MLDHLLLISYIATTCALDLVLVLPIYKSYNHVLQFGLQIWTPLSLGLDHEINPEDAAVWTAKTTIIRFTIVEMHQSDRVN